VNYMINELKEGSFNFFLVNGMLSPSKVSACSHSRNYWFWFFSHCSSSWWSWQRFRISISSSHLVVFRVLLNFIVWSMYRICICRRIPW